MEYWLIKMKSEILKSVEINHPAIYSELIEFRKSEDNAEKWLKRPHWVLNDKTPLE